MELEALRHADAREAGLRADRSGARAHVCLRADGLRLRPYRQCAAGHRLRRAVPAAAPPLRRRATSPMSATSPTSTTRSTRARPRRGMPLIDAIRMSPKRPTRNFTTDVAALGCLPPTVEPRATEHIDEMKALIERLVAARPRLCRRGPCAVRRAVDAGLRQAVEALARRDDRRRARRRRALQARRDGLRAVEAVEAGRAGLAVAVRASRRRAVRAGTSNARRCRGSISARPSTSMAAASTSCFRTTRTRSRSRAARFGTPRDGECLDAQRLPAGRRREDVEERSATSSPSASCWRTGRARCCASTCCARITASRSTGRCKGLEES